MFKRITAVLAIALLLLLALVSCGEESDVPPGMVLASKPEVDGMTVYIPEAYTVSRDPVTGVVSALISRLDPTSITAYMAYPAEATVAEYFTAHFDTASVGEGFAIEPDYPITQTVAGRDAQIYVYSYERDGVNYRTMQVYVPVGTSLSEGVAILTYTGKTDATVTGLVGYTKHLGDFEKVLQVFKLSTPAPAPSTPAVGDGMQLVSSPEKVDYRLYVPSDWTPDLLSEGMPGAFDPSDRTSVSVIRYYPEGVQTVAEYVDICVNSYKEFYDSFTAPESVETDFRQLTVAGFPAYRYEFEGTLDGMTYRFSQIFILRNKGLTQGLYTVTMTAHGTASEEAESRLDAHEDDLSAILAAFRFD